MKKRCFGEGKPFYEKYHDEEWGVASHDDQHLFEMLILEGAQAGLSWELILKKREDYQRAFHQFDPQIVASMSDQELEKLLGDPRLIRNRRKIFAARQNAKVFIKIQEEFGTFDAYLWNYVDGEPLNGRWDRFEEVPCESELSQKISKDLKKGGMAFVGPKIIYSFLQAVGVVVDHPKTCPSYRG